MKVFASAFFILATLAATVAAARAQTFYGTDNVQIFRAGREKEFRDPATSPLKPEDVPNFKGLNYFPVDAGYRVTAKFTATPDEQYFWMPTSSGRSQKYTRVGVLKFKLNGKEYALNAYQSERIMTDAKMKFFQNRLFVPFRDLTSGKETYGVGRYVYLTMPKDGGGGELTLDFNLAFNPSCAYGNDQFSCPIPPKDNFLETEIKAGEKNYLEKK
jgi:uncharacterized protein